MVDISVRPALPADVTAVWEWRNDPETRQASFQARSIPLAEHRAWFMAALEDPHRRLIIAEAPVPVGITRFDAIGGGRWTVHINLAPQWRGRGLAAEVLRRATQWLVEHDTVNEIIAVVRVTNDRSRRAFESAGFQRDEAADVDKIVLRWRVTPPTP